MYKNSVLSRLKIKNTREHARMLVNINIYIYIYHSTVYYQVRYQSKLPGFLHDLFSVERN